MKLALVGAADHESEYSRAVLEQARDMPNVVLCGFQTGQALAELFSHARVFALPSSHEGLPIVMLEAMAYGRPVVASDIEANLNVGLPAHCYFSQGDVESLTRTVSDSIDGPTTIDWSEKLQQYDWQAIAAGTVTIYNSATAKVKG
jgi:glycosyltransferase involved in cell wall biosynthesis